MWEHHSQKWLFASVSPALSSGFALPFCFFILQRTDSSVGNKSSQHDRRHSLNRSLRMRLVRQSATMQLVSIHLTMSGWSEPISSRNSPSGVSQTIWRSAARSILSLLSLHFVSVGLRRWSLSELQSTNHTLRTKRQLGTPNLCARTRHVHQPRRHEVAWTPRLHLGERTSPLAW